MYDIEDFGVEGSHFEREIRVVWFRRDICSYPQTSQGELEMPDLLDLREKMRKLSRAEQTRERQWKGPTLVEIAFSARY